MTVLGPEVEVETTPVSTGNEERREDTNSARRAKSYMSPKWVTILGYLLTFIVLLANVYVFVQLGLGN